MTDNGNKRCKSKNDRILILQVCKINIVSYSHRNIIIFNIFEHHLYYEIIT